MANIRAPLVCLPEDLLPQFPCLVCGQSKQQLLAAFDAFLCEALLLSDCTVSSLLPHAQQYMSWSERELVGAATYLWGEFLITESPETETTEAAISRAVSVFTMSSEIEVLAMQLWLLCQLGDATCDADTLINRGRCYCVSIKELLAIRVYLLGLFVGNFVRVDMTPSVLLPLIISELGGVSITTLEAANAWLICQLYNVAVQNQVPN